MAYRGGLYGQDRSSSAVKSDLIKHAPDDILANWTTNTIKLSDQLSLQEYEFGICEGTHNQWIAQGEIGLGIDSRFLTGLQRAGKTSSKSYSFFWGSESTVRPRDGSMTVGGFDTSLFENSSSTTRAFTRDVVNCREAMIVEISQLTLRSESGVVSELLTGSDKIRACVVPHVRHVPRLPNAVGDGIISNMGGRFLNASGTSNKYYYRSTLIEPSSATFKGSLSVTIYDELTVLFTPEELLFAESYVDERGLVHRNNTCTSIPLDILLTGITQRMSQIGGAGKLDSAKPRWHRLVRIGAAPRSE
ncbi:uncharacterized protein M421DRAFT_174226 [Didymella exigua CBS 183.55]|uniref:Acid protease n=1 Tax=Didymella exigua CBS 183.55 TaxID=1150837 RepID=A0A6A5RN06_9PLEO|nr:uncharacterized protein M421DRAFT_174226 [Didymella exigua CBS 183.55]KAF1927736.1 hypothetical protein M421DRAFT_174226 [Didymella exigua CBS 183.55]